jgi:hypothetical protein
VKTRIQKTLDEMTNEAVLAMALEDMEFLDLIKGKPDAGKRLAIDDKPRVGTILRSVTP